MIGKDYISITNLANGERIGMGAVEITTVPHLCILQKQFANEPKIADHCDLPSSSGEDLNCDCMN